MTNIFVAITLLATTVCVNHTYFIEINPNNEPDYYNIHPDEIITFEVAAYKKTDEETVGSTTQKVYWSYDKRLLEKVGGDNVSIQLKALKEGTTNLSAISVVESVYCQKQIKISIIK